MYFMSQCLLILYFGAQWSIDNAIIIAVFANVKVKNEDLPSISKLSFLKCLSTFTNMAKLGKSEKKFRKIKLTFYFEFDSVICCINFNFTLPLLVSYTFLGRLKTVFCSTKTEFSCKREQISNRPVFMSSITLM